MIQSDDSLHKTKRRRFNENAKNYLDLCSPSGDESESELESQPDPIINHSKTEVKKIAI